MSLTPAALRKLQEFGLTLEQVIELAELLPEKSKSKGAERQRRYRERKSGGESGAVTSDVTSDASPSDAPTPVSLPPEPPNPSAPTPFTPLKGGVSPSPASQPAKPSDVRQAFDAWNELAGRMGLPKAKTLDRARRAAITARLADGGAEAWAEALTAVERAPFCRGDNDRGFRADLDFVCQPKSWRRLREGFYAAKRAVAQAQGPPKVILAETPEEAERRRRYLRDTGQWKPEWGPRPEPERQSA